jgi:hypothetical protein
MSVSSHQGQFYSGETAENNSQTTTVEVRDQRRHNFFIVDNEVIDDFGPILKSWGLAVYLCLARHANQDSQAWPSQNTIAKEIGLSRGKVRDGIALCEETGLIKTHRRKNEDGSYSSTVYTLLPVPKKGGRPNSQPPSGEEGGWLNSQGVGHIAKGWLNSPEEDSGKKTHVEQEVSGDNDTEVVNETDTGTYEANASSTGFAGDRGQHKEQSLAQFNSRPPRSTETQYSPPARQQTAEWEPAQAMAVFLERLNVLGLPAPNEYKRKKFLDEFETLRHEHQIDKPTLRAVLKRMVERAHIPVSPLFAYKDVQDDPENYPPMTKEQLQDWWREYRESGQDSEEQQEEQWWISKEGDIYLGMNRHIGIPPASAPEEVRRRAYEIQAEEKEKERRRSQNADYEWDVDDEDAKIYFREPGGSWMKYSGYLNEVPKWVLDRFFEIQAEIERKRYG